jgi:hypothetical protein
MFCEPKNGKAGVDPGGWTGTPHVDEALRGAGLAWTLTAGLIVPDECKFLVRK